MGEAVIIGRLRYELKVLYLIYYPISHIRFPIPNFWYFTFHFAFPYSLFTANFEFLRHMTDNFCFTISDSLISAF